MEVFMAQADVEQESTANATWSRMLQGNRRISGRDCAKRPFALRQAALCHKKATRSLGRDSKDEQHKNSHYRVMDCVALFNRFQLFGYEKQGSGA